LACLIFDSPLTGRTLKLGGTFDIDIVPSPAILLEGVSLSNAEWGSEPKLAKIGHISAKRCPPWKGEARGG